MAQPTSRTPLLPHTPPPHNSTLSKVVFGGVAIFGLGGIGLTTVRAILYPPMTIPGWTALVSSLVCTAVSIFGFWQSRGVAVATPSMNEGAEKAEEVYRRLMGISQKLDEIITPFKDQMAGPRVLFSQATDVELGAIEDRSIQALSDNIQSKFRMVNSIISLLENRIFTADSDNVELHRENEALSRDVEELAAALEKLASSETTGADSKERQLHQALEKALELDAKAKKLRRQVGWSDIDSNASSTVTSPNRPSLSPGGRPSLSPGRSPLSINTGGGEHKDE